MFEPPPRGRFTSPLPPSAWGRSSLPPQNPRKNTGVLARKCVLHGCRGSPWGLQTHLKTGQKQPLRAASTVFLGSKRPPGSFPPCFYGQKSSRGPKSMCFYVFSPKVRVLCVFGPRGPKVCVFICFRPPDPKSVRFYVSRRCKHKVFAFKCPGSCGRHNL